MGDASNFHASLAAALREIGHNVTVVSDGGKWMDTRRNITLSRQPGKIGAVKYLLNTIKLLPHLKGYDIVHLISPIFLELRPRKIRLVFDYLKRNNRHVYLSAIGTDYIYVQAGWLEPGTRAYDVVRYMIEDAKVIIDEAGISRVEYSCRYFYGVT